MKKELNDSKEKQQIDMMELKKENGKILIDVKEQSIMIKNLEKENKKIKEYHEKEIKEIKTENGLSVKFAHEQIEVVKNLKTKYMENEKELIKEINDKNAEINEFKNKVNDIEIRIVEMNKLARGNMKRDIEKSEDQFAATSNIHDITKTFIDKNLKTERNSESKITENMTRNVVNAEKRQNQTRKEKRTEEIIIIMDTNNKYINNNQFWKGHSCKILEAGKINDGKIYGNYNWISLKIY